MINIPTILVSPIITCHQSPKRLQKTHKETRGLKLKPKDLLLHLLVSNAKRPKDPFSDSMWQKQNCPSFLTWSHFSELPQPNSPPGFPLRYANSMSIFFFFFFFFVCNWFCLDPFVKSEICYFCVILIDLDLMGHCDKAWILLVLMFMWEFSLSSWIVLDLVIGTVFDLSL